MPPSGKRLTDGFPTLIALADAPNISLWEEEVQPPGMEGGPPNRTTTMRNLVMHTDQPQALKSMTPMTGVCQFDPKVLTDILNQINHNQLVSVKMPNGSFWTFYGWLNEFKPHRFVPGQPPKADYTVVCGNQDNTGAEVLPAYVIPSSTTATTTTTLA